MEAVSNYVPEVGEKVLISGPNSKDYIETEVLWFDETFILYGKKGFWPCLNKREHVAIKPLTDGR